MATTHTVIGREIKENHEETIQMMDRVEAQRQDERIEDLRKQRAMYLDMARRLGQEIGDKGQGHWPALEHNDNQGTGTVLALTNGEDVIDNHHSLLSLAL